MDVLFTRLQKKLIRCDAEWWEFMVIHEHDVHWKQGTCIKYIRDSWQPKIAAQIAPPESYPCLVVYQTYQSPGRGRVIEFTFVFPSELE